MSWSLAWRLEWTGLDLARVETSMKPVLAGFPGVCCQIAQASSTEIEASLSIPADIAEEMHLASGDAETEDLEPPRGGDGYVAAIDFSVDPDGVCWLTIAADRAENARCSASVTEIGEILAADLGGSFEDTPAFLLPGRRAGAVKSPR
jgi:hypothetical protein